MNYKGMSEKWKETETRYNSIEESINPTVPLTVTEEKDISDAAENRSLNMLQVLQLVGSDLLQKIVQKTIVETFAVMTKTVTKARKT